jgi:hypothetical protein
MYFCKVKNSRKNNYSSAISELNEIRELIRGKIPKDIDYKKEIEVLRLERLVKKAHLN